MVVHVPVMCEAAIAGLAIKPDGVYLDGTFGRGGHARALLSQLGPKGRLLVLDKDPEAIAVANELAALDPRVEVHHRSFADMAMLTTVGAGLDGVLLDLGVSSPQLDQPLRGFSFMADGPLDMRMDPSRGQSVAEWLAVIGEAELADVLWRYGEERMSRRIARAVVATRSEHPITTTLALAELVKRVVGRGEPGKHPATRTFQALRMAVNRELPDLEAGLEAAATVLKAGGRLAVIGFHSLEDRIVKRFMRGDAESPPVRRNLPPPVAVAKRFRLVGGAETATAAELAENPRARSAVLRIAERVR